MIVIKELIACRFKEKPHNFFTYRYQEERMKVLKALKFGAERESRF